MDGSDWRRAVLGCNDAAHFPSAKGLGLAWERISIVSLRTTSDGESARDFSRDEE